MEKFAPLAPKIALAVSGGPDSTALVFCARRWGLRDIVALIVDHGLRPESAAEAAQVKARLQDLGVVVDVLKWTHGVVSGRIHEKARAARYGLLIEACKRHGAADLLLAHHRDDQAETVLMRLAKGSGIDGLAGIAPQNVRDGVRLVRPFLDVPKARLTATCEKAGLVYVFDPSNASEKYARGRLRKIMPLLEAEGLTADRMAALAVRAREAKEALDASTRAFLKDAAHAAEGGAAWIDRALLRDVPREIARRALAEALRYVHAEPYPPEFSSLSALVEAIVGDAAAKAQTLCGCIVFVSENKVGIIREPSAASEALPLPPGGSVLWDGRWSVRSAFDAPAATVRALGVLTHERIDALAPGLRRRIPQGRVRAALPGVWVGDALYAVPGFGPDSAFSAVFAKQAFP